MSHFKVKRFWKEISTSGFQNVCVMCSKCRNPLKVWFLSMVLFPLFLPFCSASDITASVFGSVTDGMPAAFGDFNSDKLTDMFVIRDDGKTVEVLLAGEQEPLLRSAGIKCQFNIPITSVIPGDFDGDAIMDVLITSVNKDDKVKPTRVYALWGGLNHMNCSEEDSPILEMSGQPLMLDYNNDMISDLFGDNGTERCFWVFKKGREPPERIPVPKHADEEKRLRRPHSHAYVDLNGDLTPDLFVTTEKDFEVWYSDGIEGFKFNHSISFPEGVSNHEQIGQSLFFDMSLRAKLDHVLPVCYDTDCFNSSILVYLSGEWVNLKVDFKDSKGNVWGFAKSPGKRYTDTITLRAGDFNLDGYPDLLATLAVKKKNSPVKTVLLENIGCENCAFGRTFAIRWDALSPFNETVMGTFYDFYENGNLDVILVSLGSKNQYEVKAFKNSLDYDANFVKVIVLTGLCYKHCKNGKIPYGTNLPGPQITYKTTTQDGNTQVASSAQLSQSGHFSLQLPYSIFGLGRTPNFVDAMTVGMSWPDPKYRSKEWTQIIPNSQVVVIPSPLGEPSKWIAKLFVTPSKLVLLTALALLGTCVLISGIIAALHWKERREDKKEKLQEAHKFHFDAM